MCVPGPGRYSVIAPRSWPGTAMGRISDIVFCGGGKGGFMNYWTWSEVENEELLG